MHYSMLRIAFPFHISYFITFPHHYANQALTLIYLINAALTHFGFSTPCPFFDPNTSPLMLLSLSKKMATCLLLNRMMRPKSQHGGCFCRGMRSPKPNLKRRLGNRSAGALVTRAGAFHHLSCESCFFHPIGSQKPIMNLLIADQKLIQLFGAD